MAELQTTARTGTVPAPLNSPSSVSFTRPPLSCRGEPSGQRNGTPEKTRRRVAIILSAHRSDAVWTPSAAEQGLWFEEHPARKEGGGKEGRVKVTVGTG